MQKNARKKLRNGTGGFQEISVLDAENLDWPFVDLSQLVEREGEKEILHCQETDCRPRGR